MMSSIVYASATQLARKSRSRSSSGVVMSSSSHVRHVGGHTGYLARPNRREPQHSRTRLWRSNRPSETKRHPVRAPNMVPTRRRTRERCAERRQVQMTVDAAELLAGLDHPGGAPAQRHLSVAPAFDVGGVF